MNRPVPRWLPLLLAAGGPLFGEAADPLPVVLGRAVPGVTLEGVPVRRALNRAGAANGVAVVLDRDVDPTAAVSVAAADSTVADVLAAVAAEAGAVGVPAGGAVFVAAPDRAAALRELVRRRRAELDPTPGVRRATRERALAERTIAWDDLTAPRAIVDSIAADFDLTVENPEAIPHDLWAAGRLPAADAAAALSVVLGQFDLTFAWSADRTGVRLVPIPADLGAPPAPGLASFADATRTVGEEGEVPLDRRRFTLRAGGNSVRRIMESVAASGVRFTYDARALAAGGGNLDAPADFDLTAADPDTFFTALFEPAGIAFAWEGTTVTLSPKGGANR